MQLSEKFYKNEICDKNVIKRIEGELKIVFPNDYVAFLCLSNGGEGFIGENYVSFWRCEDIALLNKDYGIQEYLSENFIAFGSDGGGECFAFDYSCPENPKIVNFAFGNLDISDLRHLAGTFTEFVELLKQKEFWNL